MVLGEIGKSSDLPAFQHAQLRLALDRIEHGLGYVFEELLTELLELGTVLRSSATRPAPTSFAGVPDRRQPFVGRSNLLATLRTAVDDTDAAPVILVGLGGVGKTTLAAELCWQARDSHPFIHWRNAEQVGGLRSSYCRLAGDEFVADSDQDAAVAQVRDWLSNLPVRGILVLDSVQEPEAIDQLVPRSGSIATIVTTRFNDWPVGAGPSRWMCSLVTRHASCWKSSPDGQ